MSIDLVCYRKEGEVTEYIQTVWLYQDPVVSQQTRVIDLCWFIGGPALHTVDQQ